MNSDFALTCHCGSENFERVVVNRQGMSDYSTEFVACVLCKVMFHQPEPPRLSDPHLERDAQAAARLYKNPATGADRPMTSADFDKSPPVQSQS